VEQKGKSLSQDAKRVRARARNLLYTLNPDFGKKTEDQFEARWREKPLASCRSRWNKKEEA